MQGWKKLTPFWCPSHPAPATTIYNIHFVHQPTTMDTYTLRSRTVVKVTPRQQLLNRIRTGKCALTRYKHIDAEMALAAVQRGGLALKFVPEALRTPELYMAAVRADGFALKFVPEALRTPELCEQAVLKDGYAIEYVPEALRTPELCLQAVRNYGYAIMHVPEVLRTPELCTQAVRNDSYAFMFVPVALRATLRATL